jgi:hypothetical protein
MDHIQRIKQADAAASEMLTAFCFGEDEFLELLRKKAAEARARYEPNTRGSGESSAEHTRLVSGSGSGGSTGSPSEPAQSSG